MKKTRLEVLVATMHQTDFSKIKEMNIRCDVIFANQADRNDYKELKFDENLARMITTDQRGVGLNRNLAMIYSNADYLLMADDDMIYADDYVEQVIQAFENIPDADVLVFAAEFSRDGKIYDRTCHKTAPLPIWRSWKYGTYVFAVRREKLQEKNIWFHTLFGGGCPYSSGEDSLFLCDCMRRGLKVYTHSYLLGCCKKDQSTWFNGYTEKYFFDKGCWLSLAMPHLCYFAVPALALKWRYLNNELGGKKIAQLMYQGITEFRGR